MRDTMCLAHLVDVEVVLRRDVPHFALVIIVVWEDTVVCNNINNIYNHMSTLTTTYRHLKQHINTDSPTQPEAADINKQAF